MFLLPAAQVVRVVQLEPQGALQIRTVTIVAVHLIQIRVPVIQVTAVL